MRATAWPRTARWSSCGESSRLEAFSQRSLEVRARALESPCAATGPRGVGMGACVVCCCVRSAVTHGGSEDDEEPDVERRVLGRALELFELSEQRDAERVAQPEVLVRVSSRVR